MTMQNKNVLLVYPEKDSSVVTGSSDIPLSLIYLWGAIRKQCDWVGVFDFNLAGNDLDRFEKIVRERDPVLVGINCLYSGAYDATWRIARFLKELFPCIRVVCGGMHPTIFAEDIIRNCDCFDAVAIGEGETVLPGLIEYFTKPDAEACKLAGVVLRRKNGAALMLPKKGYVENLDTLERPYYDEIVHEYSYSPKGWFNPRNLSISQVQLPIITSRSCANRCVFCSMRLVMGGKWRAHSPERVFREIMHAYDKFGINYFRIMDDNFTFDRNRVIALCKLIIDSGIDIGLDTPNGLMIRTLDDELIDWMVRAGCVRFYLAVESGSDIIRNKILRKNVRMDAILSVIDSIKTRGMSVVSFLLSGLPEETEETLAETEEFILNSDCDQYKHTRVTPFPGTVLFEQCRRDNLFTEAMNLEGLWKGQLYRKGHEYGYLLKPYKMSVERLNYWGQRLTRVINEKQAGIVCLEGNT